MHPHVIPAALAAHCAGAIIAPAPRMVPAGRRPARVHRAAAAASPRLSRIGRPALALNPAHRSRSCARRTLKNSSSALPPGAAEAQQRDKIS
jgi:hypothetical protein